MHQFKCATNNFVQSVPSMSCLDNGLKMLPHTPNKTKLPRYSLISHLKKKKKINNTNKKKYQQIICHFPPHNLQGCKSCKPSLTQLQGLTLYRRQTSQTLTQTKPSPTACKQVGKRQLHQSNGPTIQSLEEQVRKSTARVSLNKLT